MMLSLQVLLSFNAVFRVARPLRSARNFPSIKTMEEFKDKYLDMENKVTFCILFSKTAILTCEIRFLYATSHSTMLRILYYLNPYNEQWDLWPLNPNSKAPRPCIMHIHIPHSLALQHVSRLLL